MFLCLAFLTQGWSRITNIGILYPMAESDIAKAFRRYCHPDVVAEFDAVPSEVQKSWLDAFESICFDLCTAAFAHDFALQAMQPQFERDVSPADPACPLHRAMNRKVRTGVALSERHIVDLRSNRLPSWGKVCTRAALEANHADALRSEARNKDMVARMPGLSTFRSSLATTQKPVLSQARWGDLQPVAFRDLRPFEVAQGRVLQCTIIAEPAPMVGILLLAEDARGEVLPLQLYNQFPNSACASDMSDQAKRKFAVGTTLSIAEPFLKIMKDGKRGIRVDAASDLRIRTPGPASMSSLKEEGNAFIAQKQCDAAQQSYLAALELPEVDEVACFARSKLFNRVPCSCPLKQNFVLLPYLAFEERLPPCWRTVRKPCWRQALRPKQHRKLQQRQ